MDVRAVCRQVVAAGCDCAEWAGFLRAQLNVLRDLLRRDLHARGAEALASLELHVTNEALALPRVGLVLEACVCPADDAVKYPGLSVVLSARTEACTFCELVVLLELRTKPI